MIPDFPTDEQAKAVLMELPWPPTFLVLEAGVAGVRNGSLWLAWAHYYSLELVAQIAAEAESMMCEHRLFVYAANTDGIWLSDVIGEVDRVVFDGRRIRVGIDFVDDSLKDLVPNMRYLLAGSASVDANGVVGNDYNVHSIRAYQDVAVPPCLPPCPHPGI